MPDVLLGPAWQQAGPFCYMPVCTVGVHWRAALQTSLRCVVKDKLHGKIKGFY